jgi:perosamine synthetase
MDYGGLSCKIFEIQNFANENNLVVIEDAAEALGAKVNGKKNGSVANSSIFSFCGNKVLTTGEGGAVVTNSKEIYEKLKLIRSHGRIDSTNYFNNPNSSEFYGIGYNWRMSSITATLGLSQIQKLDKIIKMRQDNAQYISKKLSDLPLLQTPIIPNGYDHIFQMYTIRLKNNEIREKLHKFLTSKQIFSKVYFHPIHLMQYYQNNSITNSKLENTLKISKEVLTLPLYPNMVAEEKDLLVQTIHEFFETNYSN